MALVISGDSPSFSGTYQGGVITSGTAVASTSGTSIDFTSIPSWVKRITVMLNAVSTNGSSPVQLQLGTSGGVQTTSYSGYTFTGNANNVASSTGFILTGASSSTYGIVGNVHICLLDSATGTWVFSTSSGLLTGNSATTGGGVKVLSGTLDRVRLTTVNGTDAFDAGSVNILYE